MKKKSIFQNRNYMLTFLGALVSNMANTFYSFAVGFYILEISGNNAVLHGAFLAMCGITYGVVVLLGGVISDRFNKAKIMYLTDIVKGLVIIGGSLCIFAGGDNAFSIVVLFVMGFLSNVINAIFSPASSALVPRIVPEEDLMQAESYFSVMRNLVSIGGAIVAAILYAAMETYLLFIVVGVLYILSGISEMFIRYDYVKSEEPFTLKTAIRDLGEGAAYVWNFKPLLALIGLVLCVNFFICPPFENFLPLFVKTDLAVLYAETGNIFYSEMFSSFVSIASALGMIVTGLLISQKDFTGRVHKCFIAAFGAISAVLLVLAAGYFFMVFGGDAVSSYAVILPILYFVVGMSVALTNIPTGVCVQKTVAPDKLGKVSSIMDVGCQALVPISSLLGGIAINGLGIQWMLLICALGFSAVTLIVVFNKAIKKL